MNSPLRACLLQTGLVSTKRFSELEEADRIRDKVRDRAFHDDKMRKSGRANALDQLLSAKTTHEFRRATRFALTLYPDMIREVIAAAHALKCERGGKGLVWQIYQIRDHLPSLGTESSREQFLENALGRNGTGFLTVRKK